MSAEKADPFDKTKIMAGIPAMPAEATQILPAPMPEDKQASQPVPKPAPPKARRGGALAIWVAVVLALTGGMTWWLLGSRPAAPGAVALEPVDGSAPPALQGYLAAAKQGDAKAMRMLGASYTYGLGVRANPAEGADWYRKAAAAGDKMAEAELRAAGANK